MATKILKKQYQEYDCLQGAKMRIKYLYQTYDKVIVDFSGGKDSTAMLYVCLEVAREMGKLPVEAVYIDHEIEGLYTTELVEEVRKIEGINLIVYALPFILRNSTSFNSPEWFPWHPQEKQLWVRPLPEYALTEMENYFFEYDENYQHPDGLPFKALGVKQAMSFQEICDQHCMNYRAKGMTAISLVGIRAEESMARYTIMSRKSAECYISELKAYPIYDWLATDVWKYCRDIKLPYNKEYDLMNRSEHYQQLNKQRVGSIFGEESLRTLHQWRTFYGDYWHKILERVEGVKTAWRYNNEGVYTGTKITKLEGVKWSEYVRNLLVQQNPKTRAMTLKALNSIITWHKGRTDYPISENEKEANPLTGISWEFLSRIAIRGDSKERNLQRVTQIAGKAQERAGLTRDEAVQKYGNAKYKQRYYEQRTTE